MKLTVFGATGGTGTHVVRQALAAGHDVTAVVRDPARLAMAPCDQLHVECKSLTDPEALSAAIAGRDAVISTLGARTGRAPTTICTTGTANIMQAMSIAGVRRLVVVSNSGMIADDGDGPVVRRIGKPLLQRVLRHPYADMAGMEGAVREASLDWTILRPPMLTNGARTGHYRSRTDANIPGGRTIARADLASAILDHLDDRGGIGAAIFVAH